MDARRELGVLARDGRSRELSGMRGAAMASLDVGLCGLCAHISGEGVSPLRADSEAGLEEAAESGLWMGLNSLALALSRRGEESGDAGRLAVNWA